MPTYILAIDQGTTSSRAMVFDRTLRIVGRAQREFRQHFPKPGWVEHDPEDIWRSVVATCRAAIKQARIKPAAIAGIGITNQRETAVIWDRRTGKPIHRAIVWQDRRTAERCEQLEDDGRLPLVRERTGLVLDPYFSGTKLEWLLGPGGVEAGPDVAFGTIDSWLLWKLTGGSVHATDVSNASRTMLFDIRERAWSDALLEMLHVSRTVLPEVRPSSGRFGVTAAEAPCGAGIPISGIAGDQQAALFGQACVVPGMSKNTYGTGSFVLMNVGETCPEPVEGLLTTIAWTLDQPGGPVTHYALEGAIFVTGAAVQWLRDGLEIIDDAAEVGPLAESVADTEGVVFVPAFTGLGSPWWDPYARGTIVGITRGTTRAHLARAVVESMAFQTRDVVDAMVAASGRDIGVLRVDGGASQMDLLLQLQADQLGVTVARPRNQETTALGAAYLAGLAEGVWSLDDLDATWQLDREAAPQSGPEVDAAYARWTRAVERSRGWARST
jgi:glycerol kinase